MKKLNAKKLRINKPTKEELAKIKRNPIYFVLDEIYDTYNIGSMFRLADAVAAEKVFLCGNMEYPPSIKIHRAAIGTQEWVPWKKTNSTLETVKSLKKKGIQVVAVEQDSNSVSYKDFKPKFPVALVLGHETKGVRKEVLDTCDAIVELPLMGINKSFNVWGSASIVAYKILEGV